MHAPVICTIVAKNYLAHARCLAESFLAQHPDGRVFVLLADERGDAFDPAGERFTTLEAHDLGIPSFDQMAFRYTVVEFNTAVKPFLLEYLFDRYDLQSLCYFDPDIYFYQPLTHLLELLEAHSVVLTPHLLDVLDDDKLPDEPYIMRAGVYNLGFIGLSRGPELRKLLRWWQQKLLKDCVVDAARGLFVDQRWIDLVPAIFESVAIIRDPGYNAAYWNLKHRQIEQHGGQWRVNGGPLTFYHFSGLPMHEIDAISKHQNRYTLDDRPEMRPLFELYRDRLLANGYETVKRWPYAYGVFDNGVGIPDAARYLWRNLDDGARWPHPFETAAPDSFLSWLNLEVQPGPRAQPLITNLAMEIYRGRWDLQQAFPDVLGTHRVRFARWFAEKAPEQYGLDSIFAAPVRQSVAAVQRKQAVPRPPAPGAPAPASQPRGMRARLYYGVRDPLRRAGLHTPLRRLLGQRRVEALYALLVQRPPPAGLLEAPLMGQPTVRRRVYYAVRNPLRRAGLHAPLKRLIGQKRFETFYARMVGNPSLRPEALTRTPQRPPMNTPPLAPAGPREGINIVGYVRAETGMGEVPRAIARALHAAGYPVAVTDLSNADWARAEDISVLHLPTGNPYAYTLLCVNADMVPTTMQQLGPAFFAGKYTIGFWHWETANFPLEWHDRFACLEEIWVDSSYVQKTLAAAAPIPVVNVHLPVNGLQPSRLGRAELGLPADRFIFLFSFDMHSFVQRKNPYGLIEAYRRAFGAASQHTALVIKITNATAFAAETERLRAELATVGGTLIDRYLGRPELSGLFACCDCYVSLHRSEGFGLTIAEAMALGKPVIATAYSGNMEFMTPANSYLVGYRLAQIDGDYGPYRAGDEWAEPDLDHAAQLMREVAEQPGAARQRGLRAAEDMQAQFGSAAVAKRVIARIGALSRGAKRVSAQTPTTNG